MKQQRLVHVFAIIGIILFSGIILIYAKPFLVPVLFAAVLSMLLLREVHWLEKIRLGKVFPIIIAILTLLAAIALIVFLLGWQLRDLMQNSPDIKKQLTSNVERVQNYLSRELNVTDEQQKKVFKRSADMISQKGGSFIPTILKGIGSVLTNAILMLVYIFLFLYFRGRLKNFLLKLVPPGKRDDSSVVLSKIQHVAQQYLGSMALMIVVLWVMYGIGFSIIGVKQPLFFAVFCGILEIVPFVGNLTGTAVTIILSVAQGGSGNLIIGIIITYVIVQFIQTYFLEPLIVGKGVRINPLATIAGLVAGELIWGIPGMVLAIPLIGMLKIVCDHIEPLKPYGYLLGNER